MKKILIVSLLFVSLTGLSRDSREVKKQYTKNLRLWLGSIEAATDDYQYPDGKQRLATTKKNLKLLFEKISVKLSTKRRLALEKSLNDYLKTFPEPSNEAFIKIRRQTLDYFRVIRSPPLVPDYQLGQLVYSRYCQVCHGADGEGNGPFTKNRAAPMKPLPKSFISQRKLGVRAPFSYFNTLLVGIPGTSMSAFEKTLTFHEMWSVSFYLSAFDKPNLDPGKLVTSFTSKQLADLTNLEILMRLKELDLSEDQLFYLRNYSSFSKTLP